MLDDVRLLLIVPAILGLFAQQRVRATFTRWSHVPNIIGITGEETARRLLWAQGVQGVTIEQTTGALTDHYDPKTKKLRLSDDVAGARSVAALGIAAHEAAHAVQDAEGSRLHKLRMTIGEPLARASQWSGFLFVGAFWLRIPVLMYLTGTLLAGYVLFALVTLPVELGASWRALHALEDNGLAVPEEISAVRRVLRAAAGTYIAALSQRVGIFLFLAVGVVLSQG